MNLGEALKEKRISNNMTLEQLANELTSKYDYPINITTLSQYENNKRTPSVEFLIKISDYYSCSIDELLGKQCNDYNTVQINDIKYLLINKIITEIKTMDFEKLNEFIELIIKFFNKK